MRKILILIILILSLNSFGQNCSMLPNGKYEIQYDARDFNSDFFEIIDNHYYSYSKDSKKEYDIQMLSDCSFRLINNEKIDESKLTDFQKMLAKQKTYFEIIKVENNIFYFICRVNLHVQCGTGKFIKKS